MGTGTSGQLGVMTMGSRVCGIGREGLGDILRRFAPTFCSFLLLLLAVPSFAQSFPPLTGRVVDQAKLLSAAQAAQLEAKLAQLEAQSGRQMVVATVPSLQGYPIEDFGYRLGRAWGIGEKTTNSGLLLLVAPTERKVRIEVGYGLEPIVTDALASVIINQQIRPHFRDKDYAGGINAAADALIALLQLPPAEAEARSQQIVASSRQQQEDGNIPFSLIFWVVVMLFIFGSSIAGRFGGGRRYRGGSGPIVIWGGGGDWGGGGGWGSGSGGGGFSGGGGSFGGGGASGDW